LLRTYLPTKKLDLIMKARLLMAASGLCRTFFHGRSSGTCQGRLLSPKTECCQGKEAAKAGDKSTKKETAKRLTPRKWLNQPAMKAA
jgi:hypothetical protein